VPDAATVSEAEGFKLARPALAEATQRHPAVVTLVVAHAFSMVVWSVLRHEHFGSAAYDLGAYENVFWNLGQRGTLWNSVERVHQWSNHLEIGLLWLWLPFRIAPSPVWLFLIQQISCAAAALPLEAMVRRASGDRNLAAIAAVAMLVTPQLLLAEIYDFHSITATAFPVALLAWGVESDSPGRIGLGASLAMSVREQMGLVLVAAALAWILRHGWRARWPMAVAFAVLGIGVFLAEVQWLIPSFAGGGMFRYVAEYGRLGGTPSAALRFVYQHPLRLLSLPFEGGRILYLILLGCGALPLLALSLRSPRVAAWPLLLAAPLLLIQLFNDRKEVWNIHYQYGAAVVPLLAACAGLALADERCVSFARRRVFAGIWLGGTGLVACFAVLVKLYGDGRPIDPEFPSSERAQALRNMLSTVPDGAAVSALDRLAAHLADRPTVHNWPDGEQEDQFVVLETGGMKDEREERLVVQAAIERLRHDARFLVRFDQAGVVVMERAAAAPLRSSAGGDSAPP
jgi:uncharacterized membrane protein